VLTEVLGLSPAEVARLGVIGAIASAARG